MLPLVRQEWVWGLVKPVQVEWSGLVFLASFWQRTLQWLDSDTRLWGS